jgi:outer membrane receptor protein involved in Fe transport
MLKFICKLAILLLMLVSNLVFGQENKGKITINGRVVSESGQPVADAVVCLLSAADSKIVKSEISDPGGTFLFQDVAAADYALRISVGDKIRFEGSPFTANAPVDVGIVQLQPELNALTEVVVTRPKQYIERREGKMILNVDSAIGSTGSSAFEVLEKAPGVNVDNNDNISLRGKGGILVQIDGKITPMTGTNLANYLRGIPSNAVDKIEFITNPGAKYDASGSAIINIKMKKDKRNGTNGSITSAYGQGRYPKSNSSLTLNNRSGKFNFFGMYSFAYREWFNELLLNRSFYDDGVFQRRYDQDNWLKMNFRNHIGRVGADFLANKKHTIGIVAGAVSNKFNPTGRNVSDVYGASNTQESVFTTGNHSRDHWHNRSANVNHKFVIDTLGTELTTDLDYANYGNETTQNFTTRYFNPGGAETQPAYLLYGNLLGDLDIYSLKTDFVTAFRNKVKFETGIKGSYVEADNDVKFYDASSGSPVFDPTKSNHFIYKENINAAYANFSKDFDRWSVYLGFRVENTNIDGVQLVDHTAFKNSYTQLFPSAFASYKWSDTHSTEFNYSRRISRPSYDQLNPFKFYLDPTTYKEGNPYLDPQTTHSIEFTHVYNQKMYATLSFSRTQDNITEVIAPSDNDPNVTVQTNKNLDTADIFGLFLIIPADVTAWWRTSNSVNFYYGSYSGTVANTTIENEGNFTFNCNSVNNFKLGNGYSAEFTGNYRARELYAYMDVDPIWSINVGFQKKFNSSVLKLALNDIFYTSRTTADTEFTGYREHFKVSRDTRVAVLSYTYNFGKGNGSQRRRTGGADDIKQRAGSANG